MIILNLVCKICHKTGELMFFLGTAVNGLCILIGSLLGKLFHRIPESIKKTAMQGISLTVIVLGLQMSLETKNILVVILSLVFGAIIGEMIDLEGKLQQLGDWVEKKMGNKFDRGNFSQGFVTATLIFVIGAMAIIGALDSEIRGDHSVLFTKGIIDGFTALVLTTTLGLGVIFSVIPVVLYEGTVALFATQIDQLISEKLMDHFILEMTATGGVMIFALGLNILGLTKIRVANLLPGIIFTFIIVTFMDYFPF